MVRRFRFIRALPARKRLARLLGGVCLGLLLAGLQAKFQFNPRIVQIVLLVVASILVLGCVLGCVLLVAAYVKELRREEEEDAWAGRSRNDEDAD